MDDKLQLALSDDIWKNHQIGNEYQMDGKKDRWKIVYYPIFEDGKMENNIKNQELWLKILFLESSENRLAQTLEKFR